MYESLIENKKEELDKAIERFKEEMGKLRTGRANPALVENVLVDYYGTKTPLNQLATISVPEPRLIVISPWDKNALTGIESAIKGSDLGLNPANDGQVVRVSIPALTEERRKELVKVLNQKAEEARIAVRTGREDVWKIIQDMEKKGKISEDDKFRSKDKLQKVVDEYNKQIEELRDKKEREIMTV
ncbi:MAG: ribosome recycling factor [Candidatus Moranbacteria bacterium]|nr:ribosome recycling factor [Candidatus Moranbacteria bacterium]